ncbi:MAG TPA: DUF4157 domain-containing protein [Kofleriaceae bacterium]
MIRHARYLRVADGHAPHPAPAELDPIGEGLRLGLSRATLLQIWHRVVEDTADADAARARFLEVATRLARIRRTGVPGKSTLVDPADTDLAPYMSARASPGKDTQALALTRRWERIDSSSVARTEHREVATPQAPELARFRPLALREVFAAQARSARSASLATLALATAPNSALWRITEHRAAVLYRQANGQDEVQPEAPAVEEALARIGHGSSLDPAVRREMEQHLEASFEHVRIHTGQTAADAARALRADAFTVGSDIYFAQGAFAPQTQAGRKLLAHELTHVVQAQRGQAAASTSQRSVSSPGERLEREAEASAERIARAPAPSQPALASTTAAAIPPSAHGRIHRKPSAPGGTPPMW